MLRSLIQERRQSAAKQERPNYMPRSMNHESEQGPSKWVHMLWFNFILGLNFISLCFGVW